MKKNKVKVLRRKFNIYKKHFKKIYSMILKMHLKNLVLIAILLLISSYFTILTASKLAEIIDSVTVGVSMSSLASSIGIYIGVVICETIISFYCSYCNNNLILKAVNDLKILCLDKIFSRSGSFFSENEYGELENAIESDTVSFCEFILGNLFSILYTLSSLIFYVVYLAMLNWRLLLVVLLIQPLVLVFQFVFSPKIMKKSQKHRDNNVKYSSILQTIISRPIELIMSGSKNNSFKKLKKSLDDTYDSGKSLTLMHLMSSHIIVFISAITTCIVIGLGGYFIVHGKMTIGALVVFIEASKRLISIITSLSDLTFDYSEIKPIYKRLNYYLDYNRTESDLLLLNDENNDITFKNVEFSYDDGDCILHDINCCFKYGNNYGIIGKTGEGKSTIIKLIFNLWKPTGGKILIGNNESHRLISDSIGNDIMYISANPIMFNDSVYNNIVSESSVVDEKKVYEILKKLRLYDDIIKLDNGIQSNIGDGGVKLSTGQRQRIAIARALLSDKKIIIMDEPTASIDSDTEKAVMYTIYKELSDKTLIIITHDRHILYECDEIMEIKNKRMSAISVSEL